VDDTTHVSYLLRCEQSVPQLDSVSSIAAYNTALLDGAGMSRQDTHARNPLISAAASK
jgi:hypothetical protein